MTNHNEVTEQQINERMDMLDRVLLGWEKNLEQLEAGKDLLDDDEQESFQAEVDQLEEQLEHIQVRLQSMKEGDPKEWYVGHKGLRDKMESFKADMERLTARLGPAYEPDDSDWEDDYDHVTQLDSLFLYAGTYDNQIV